MKMLKKNFPSDRGHTWVWYASSAAQQANDIHASARFLYIAANDGAAYSRNTRNGAASVTFRANGTTHDVKITGCRYKADAMKQARVIVRDFAKTL